MIPFGKEVELGQRAEAEVENEEGGRGRVENDSRRPPKRPRRRNEAKVLTLVVEDLKFGSRRLEGQKD